MPTPYPTSSRGISHYSTLVNVPDSITTWQLVAVSLKAGKGDPISPELRKWENGGPAQPQDSWPLLNANTFPWL